VDTFLGDEKGAMEGSKSLAQYGIFASSKKYSASARYRQLEIDWDLVGLDTSARAA